ncbi:MAG: helix-turn-helix domain-containing protein [bacterium]
MDNLDKILEKLGLTIKAKKVYKLILESGKIAPVTISRKTGINRTTVYSVANELKARGLIIEDLGSKTLYYLPAQPEEIDKILEHDRKEFREKEEGLHELKDALKLVSQSTTFSIPKIRFVAEEDIDKYLHDATPRWIESNLANDPTWWGFQDHTFVEKYKNWIVWFWKHAPKEVNLKMFSNDSDIESQMQSEKINQRNIRFWKGTNNITGTQWIIGSYIVLIVTAQKPCYLVEIHDSVMAHNMREVFKELWNK